MSKEIKVKKRPIKAKHLDFKCDCGETKCGNVRFCLIKVPLVDNSIEKIIDVGFFNNKQKRPKIGVVIRGKNSEKLIKFLNS
jgi:hypothetical protein